MKLLLFVLSFCGTTASANFEKREFDAKGLDAVLLEIISGNITIVGTKGAKATVAVTKNKFPNSCTMTIDQSGSKLVISVESHEKRNAAEGCDVDFVVETPKSVSLDLAVGSGDISVNGVNGDLAFKIGSGDLSANGTFTKISGKSGSGRTTINGLTGGGELQSGSGPIHLEYTGSAPKGDLNLKLKSGNAQILVPKGTPVKTKLDSATGPITNEAIESPSALLGISMKTGYGSLVTKSY